MDWWQYWEFSWTYAVLTVDFLLGSSFCCSSDEPFRCRLSGGAEVWGLVRGPPLGGPLHLTCGGLGLDWGNGYVSWSEEQLYSGVCSCEVMSSPCPQETGRGWVEMVFSFSSPLFAEPRPERMQRSQPWSSQGGGGRAFPVRVLFKKGWLIPRPVSELE